MTSQEYFPGVSLLHSCRHSRIHKFSVTLVLYLYEAYSCFPSLYHVTNNFGAPVKVHSSLNLLVIGKTVSVNLFRKHGGSKRGSRINIFVKTASTRCKGFTAPSSTCWQLKSKSFLVAFHIGNPCGREITSFKLFRKRAEVEVERS